LVVVNSRCFTPFYTFLSALLKVAFLHVYTSQNSAEITGINLRITKITVRKRALPPCIA